MATLKAPTLGPFRGMNNRLPDQALATREGDWLRSLVNLDVIAGKLRLRPGYAMAQAGAAVHSLWGDGGEFGFYVDGTTLYRIRTGPDGTVSREAVATVSAGAIVSFDRADDGTVYFANGIQQGRDDGTTLTENWGTAAVAANTPTEHCRTMPAGTIVRLYRNRLLTVRGSTLYVSDPWTFNLYNPVDGTIPFLGTITAVAALESGVFVTTDKATYWLAGDLVADLTVRQVLAYGALPYSECAIPNAQPKASLWMSPRGIVRGTDDGAATNLQEGAVATSGGESAAVLYREYDGARRVVAAVASATDNVTAAQSFMDAEIVRKGTTV